MIKRYLKYVELRIFDDEDRWFNDLQSHVLDRGELTRLRRLHGDMSDIESVTKRLQADGITDTIPDHALVRTLFDRLIVKFPCFRLHLSADAEIVHKNNFESAIVMIQSSAPEESLLPQERDTVRRFLKPEDGGEENDDEAPASKWWEVHLFGPHPYNIKHGGTTFFAR